MEALNIHLNSYLCKLSEASQAFLFIPEVVRQRNELFPPATSRQGVLRTLHKLAQTAVYLSFTQANLRSRTFLPLDPAAPSGLLALTVFP